MIRFGAVATGSMNAQLALIAAGTIIRRGSMPAPTAVAARIGISRAVVAVLLVASVRNVTARHTARMSRYGGKSASPASASPIEVDNPEDANALAMAMPPPNRISMPQGIF
jgi:7-keto-8-aminopelargonate synthetase-like enzyme